MQANLVHDIVGSASFLVPHVVELLVATDLVKYLDSTKVMMARRV